MTAGLTKFWGDFNKQNFTDALQRFDELDNAQKEDILSELFQKTEYHRKPVMVSVLSRELRDGKSFDDFYQAWLPSKDMCNRAEIRGQVFQQHFPIPVRVINAININNSKEIISIGLNWVANKEEEQALWEYVKKTSNGENENNEIRHDRIDDVADGKLLGLFRVEKEDNLGTPF